MKRIIAAAAIALCFVSISIFAASVGEIRYRVTIRDTEVAPVEEIAASLAGTYGGEISGQDSGGHSFVILTTPERAKLMLENRSVARIESLSAGANAHSSRMTTNIQVNLGTYLYDGSGNIRTIDVDDYVYDKVGRVKTATVSSVSQSYNYDGFGNLNTITTGGGVLCAGLVVCGRTLAVSSQNNHITSNNAHYTDAGSLDSLDSYTYTYDDLGMMRQQRIGSAIVRQFVYTADDERLATYVPSGVWSWTVRDLSGAVLRSFTSQDSGSNLAAANWQWNEDYIYRGSLLLATKSSQGVRHLHLDHLGSPRLVTDDSGHQVGIHKYLPFGAELNVGTRENPEEMRKFTGHERDGLNVASTLDYMHARYYGWGIGRFLSVDPYGVDRHLPQSWNRYAYALNSPTVFVDPYGLFAGPTDDEKCKKPDDCPEIHEDITVTADSLGPTRPRQTRDEQEWHLLNKILDLARAEAKKHHTRPPDYVSVTGGIVLPFFVGGGGVVTVDRYGRVYFAPVFMAGTPGKGLGITAGWLNHAGTPGRRELTQFVSGLSAGGSGAMGAAGAITWGGPGSGTATEVGAGTPGLNGSASWGFMIYDAGHGWDE